MRIVVDLQACQLEGSRNRCIGRYSHSLAHALARLRGDDDLRIALNANYSEEAEEVIAAFAGVLPRSSFSFYRTPIVKSQSCNERDAFRRVGSEIAHHHFASLSPDIVHNCSPFSNSEVREMSLLEPQRVLGSVKAATLYNLIPLTFEDVYLHDPMVEALYRENCHTLSQYDLLLSTSEASKRNAVSRLGVSSDNIVTIMGAADPMFRPIILTEEERSTLLKKYQIEKPFLLYTASPDHRENIAAAIKAFANLPDALRNGYQFVMLCKASDKDRLNLYEIAGHSGVGDAVVIIDYVPNEDLVGLYNFCRLFCFPSFYESFGGPALEAMACGAPTIGADNSSIHELIGRRDATFDVTDNASITALMVKVLSDDGFADDLRVSGLARAKEFTWENSAASALAAYREAYARADFARLSKDRPKPSVVMMTPLPPQKSGIADYSDTLLPYLKEAFDIKGLFDGAVHDLAHEDPNVLRPFENFPDVVQNVDIPIYQMGNSSFHANMVEPIIDRGGILVLHDIYLGHLLSFMSKRKNYHINFWEEAAIAEINGNNLYCNTDDLSTTIDKNPANLRLLEASDGIIVHSNYAADLIAHHFPRLTSPRIRVIPLPREAVSPTEEERASARAKLGVRPEIAFGISLGFVTDFKGCYELLETVERLCDGLPNLYFAFVGDSDFAFRTRVAQSRHRNRIKITGFVSNDLYRTYLLAANFAVQLRKRTRGESSLTALDCLAYGVPLVVNDYASFSEFPSDVVVKVRAKINPQSMGPISDAIASLLADEQRQAELRRAGLLYVAHQCSPKLVAEAYGDAIRCFLEDRAARNSSKRISKIENIMAPLPRRKEFTAIADALRESGYHQASRTLLPKKRIDAYNFIRTSMHRLRDGLRLLRQTPFGRPFQAIYRVIQRPFLRQYIRHPKLLFLNPYQVLISYRDRTTLQYNSRLFIDVTATNRDDLGTGIQRVVRDTVHAMDNAFFSGDFSHRTLPVTLKNDRIVLADKFLRDTGSRDELYSSTKIGYCDTLLMLDSSWDIYERFDDTFSQIQSRGGKVFTVVYDLVPLIHPDICGDGLPDIFLRWLRAAISRSDGLVCISRVVADELVAFMNDNDLPFRDGLKVGWFHLGSDIKSDQENISVRSEVRDTFRSYVPTFLMVGTIEPRKRHSIVLDAMEMLWRSGSVARLVFMGKRGWKNDEFIERMSRHPEMGRRFFWIEGASDSELALAFKESAALIFASIYEGYGLPIVEAARAGLPVICSDIPIHREVAGSGAEYFTVDCADSLANSIRRFLRDETHPDPSDIKALTWEESARQLREVIYGDNWYATLKRDDSFGAESSKWIAPGLPEAPNPEKVGPS